MVLWQNRVISGGIGYAFLFVPERKFRNTFLKVFFFMPSKCTYFAADFQITGKGWNLRKHAVPNRNHHKERRGDMLGIPDFWIWSAYLLCLLSAAACVIYGIYNWNKGDEEEPSRAAAEKQRETVQSGTAG